MNPQKGSIYPLIAVLAIAAVLGGLWYKSKLDYVALDSKYKTTTQALKHLQDLNEISISEGIQVGVATFEFINIPAEITFRLRKTYDKPTGGVGILKEHVDILYKTPYTFTYGYDLRDWNWCPSISSTKPGYVVLRKPKAIWTNRQTTIAPVEWIPIKGVNYMDLGPVVQADASKLLAEKIEQRAKTHLSDTNMNQNMERALKEFLQNVMNSSYKDSNPVRGIVFTTNLDDECKVKS